MRPRRCEGKKKKKRVGVVGSRVGGECALAGGQQVFAPSLFLCALTIARYTPPSSSKAAYRGRTAPGGAAAATAAWAAASWRALVRSEERGWMRGAPSSPLDPPPPLRPFSPTHALTLLTSSRHSPAPPHMQAFTAKACPLSPPHPSRQRRMRARRLEPPGAVPPPLPPPPTSPSTRRAPTHQPAGPSGWRRDGGQVGACQGKGCARNGGGWAGLMTMESRVVVLWCLHHLPLFSLPP